MIVFIVIGWIIGKNSLVALGIDVVHSKSKVVWLNEKNSFHTTNNFNDPHNVKDKTLKVLADEILLVAIIITIIVATDLIHHK
jgi:hypothetical protein